MNQAALTGAGLAVARIWLGTDEALTAARANTETGTAAYASCATAECQHGDPGLEPCTEHSQLVVTS